MNESSIFSLFEFMVKELPELFQNITYYLFTPLRDILGDNVANILSFIEDALGLTNPFLGFIVDNLLDPVLDIGLIGLFSSFTLALIVILKVIDLVIPT